MQLPIRSASVPDISIFARRTMLSSSSNASSSMDLTRQAGLTPSGRLSSAGTVVHDSHNALRSCLVVRPEPLSVEVNGNDSLTDWSTSEPTSPLSLADSDGPLSPASRAKKRVVFADAKGLSLTQIKMMTEPSDCPPRWTAEFLEQVTGGAHVDVGADRWELTFSQPASDYLEFRNRLDQQNLSLENVVVREADQQLAGSIKVKNLAFTKQVTVRITFDNWLSFRDFLAVFAPSGLQGASGTQAISLFDTFAFQVPIPVSATTNRMQFCIRFRSDAGEFWDNNQGKNYVLVKADPLKKLLNSSSPGAALADAANNNSSSSSSSSNLRTANNNTNNTSSRLNSASRLTFDKFSSDIMSPKGDYWSDFPSWNRFVNDDSPYW